MPILRLLTRAAIILAIMVMVEFAAFLFNRELGINRLYWVPVSLGLIAFAGYDTVRRMPMIWGATISGLLAGFTSVISWMVAEYVLHGSFSMPAEAEPPLVGTTFLVMAIVGGIVGVSAGTFARSRRRKRSRRSALGKLAYTAFDEDGEPYHDPSEFEATIAIPMANHTSRRA
jgi:hypothetical protein